MAIYYVDPSKSDSNDGLSPATAWATIAKAMAVGLVDGDTLSLKGGATHAGAISINVPSTTLGITITSYGGGQATIRPDDTTYNGIVILETSNVLVDNIKVQGSGFTLSGSFPTATATTVSVGSGVIVYATTASIQYQNITIQNCAIDGMLRGIALANFHASPTVSHRNVTIQDCVISSCGLAGVWVNANIYTAGSPIKLFDHLIVRRCSLVNIYAVTATAPAFSIQMFGCSNSLVEKCYVAFCSQYAPNTGTDGPAGILNAYSDGTIIRECEVRDVYSPSQYDGTGIDADLGCTNILVERCYVYNCHGEGLQVFGNATGTVFRECVVHRNGLYMRAGDSRGAQVRFDQAASLIHCSFYGDGSLQVRPAMIFETSVGGSTYVNNIFVTVNGATIGTVHAPTLIGNCYGSAFSININAADYTSLAALHAAGFEKFASVNYGLAADPQLANPSVASTQWPTTGTPATLTNFDLANPGSPALNTALDAATLLSLTNVGPFDFHGYPLKSSHGTGFSFGATQEASSGGGGTAQKAYPLWQAPAVLGLA